MRSRNERNSSKSGSARLCSTALLLASLALPGLASAEAPRVAVLVSQSLNVGDLPDRVGLIAADVLRGGRATVISPVEASMRLRNAKGPDPLECGTDTECLVDAGRALKVDWVVAIGLGKLGDMYGLDVRAVDVSASSAPRTYQQSYKEPGPDWANATAEAVRKVVPAELLVQRGSFVQVVANQDDAEIWIDGFASARTPLKEPIAVAPGTHAIELRKEGFSVARRELTVAAGATESIELYVVAVSSGGGPTLSTWGVVTAGVGAVALGTGIWFHLASNGSASEANELNRQGKDFSAQKEQALSEISTARVLYGVAGAAAIGAGLLFWADDDDDEPRARRP